MIFVDKKEIIKVFNQLNSSGIEYVLIRNINNELPSSLEMGKDIDILFHIEDKNDIYSFFKKNGYSSIKHPLRNELYLYGARKFEFRYSPKSKIYFDLNFQLTVRSLNAGELIPLDQKIQESAWLQKRKIVHGEFEYWSMCCEDEFVTLIARAIFDKNEFPLSYIENIDALYPLVDQQDVLCKMNLIFFKYAPFLLNKIKYRDYSTIIDDYVKFGGY